MRHREIEENSPEYFRLLKQQQEKSKQEASKHRMALAILNLTSPVKKFSVSKLKYLSVEQLVNIGKAARALHEELEKAKLNGQDYIRYNNRDF